MESNPIVDYKAYVARREAEEEAAKNEGDYSEDDFFAAQTALASTRQGFEDENKINSKPENNKVVSSGTFFEQKKNEEVKSQTELSKSKDEEIGIETISETNESSVEDNHNNSEIQTDKKRVISRKVKP